MAVKVTTKIKEVLQARDRKILDGTDAVLSLLQEVKKEIVAELATGAGSSFQVYRLKQSLAAIERHLSDFQSGAERELGSGISAMWAEGQTLLPEAAAAAEMQVGNFWLSTDVVTALKEFTFGRISSVTGDLYNKIRGEITLGILGQKSPQEVAGALSGMIENVPIPNDKWGNPIFKSAAERAEVITQTEMGRAFSLATQESLDSTQDTLPEMKKMWLHAGHPRTPRQVHLLMHGQVRAMDKPFYETRDGGQVMYPRDPNAPISEVIRCGCTHIPYMTAWGDAKTFAKDFDEQQKKANQKKAA